jgi:membrane protein YqaA with SNARE-associated domain
VRAFGRWALGLFLSPAGILVLAALDSTLFFSLPFGIDAAVIVLAARMRSSAWLVPLLATCGATAGAALTFWMGRQIGEKGLDRYASPRRLARIRRRVNQHGAIALAVLDLVPPPFPFTLFVLAAGALDVKPSLFFITLALCRLLRFGAEAALAYRYGTRIVGWLDTGAVHDAAAALIAIAGVLTALSLVRLIRLSRASRSRSMAA